jgi:hypothetical protein
MVLGRRAPIIKKHVMGYTINPQGQMENALTCDSILPLGAGAYFSSADDLTRYIADLFSDNVPAAVHQMMFHNVSLEDGTKVNYLPAALVESDFYGHKRFGHGGGYFGFLAYMAYYPDDKVAIVVLTNTDSVESKSGNLPTSATVSRISHVVLGIPEPKIADLPLSSSEAKAYVGTYRLREFITGINSDTVTFFYTQNSLFMKIGSGTPRANWYAAEKSVKKEPGRPMQGAVQLLNQGNGRFLQKGTNDGEVTFINGRGAHPSVRIGEWFSGSIVAKN